MPYIHITRNPRVTLADYHTVSDALGGDRPEGNLISIAGEGDGALHTVDVWESKAHADRFEAERLIPAFQKTGQGPPAGATRIAFETNDVWVSADVR